MAACTRGSLARVVRAALSISHLGEPSNFTTTRQPATSRPPPHARILTQSPIMASQSVQCFGKKKTATAVAHCKAGKGLIKVNGKPLSLVQPEILRFKVYEPVLILGVDKFADVDIRVRVSGGGHTSQIYAIRQAIAKSIIAYYQKYVDEHSKNQLKQALVQYDRTLLVADNRRCEPKKFGGPGARARYQKSYR
ncbi:hypothetical protein SNOG_08214 [Parastagonospora nodorum SN15]|uniref:40S ribosomal protein S16 n=2 Tax=Phaeosphaeria nodorum (strain SN15 / ATCC MYA-4574 / FGSC 10173) TaxID=321614 RepID=Q0UJ50_PHANO|nr:hypothetical protein SNOG_08214 [Parastagonospora nodorum SN15]EAT84490.2 hypothetical protein SNOG_08214 [Parastagonospora nodorum SN15]